MEPDDTDRFVTCKNIDCEDNSRRLMTMLRRRIDDPGKRNVFGEAFKKKRTLAGLSARIAEPPATNCS